jgi:uncharacterized protein (DUF2345 family)
MSFGAKDISTLVGLAIPNQPYTGKQISPKKLTFTKGKKTVTLKAPKNFTVASCGTNVKIGKGTATVVLNGTYAGSKTISFKIVPSTSKVSKVKAASGKATVYWKAVSKAQKITKYQVRYKTSKGGKWKTKTFSAKSKKGAISKLKHHKKYSFEVRSYKKVGKTKYYANWSKAKSSKTK